MTHITGVFNTRSEADAATDRLLAGGFRQEDIRLVSNNAKPAVVVNASSDMFKAVRLALHSGHETIEAA